MENGLLTLIVGPMFSGKTTELHRLFERKIRAGINCILIKYTKDDRYSTDHVVSHKDMFGNYKQIPCVNISYLRELHDIISNSTVKPETIFIDEIQFFPDKEVIDDILSNGINVIASGLNGDWQRKMFPGMADLFSLAYEITMCQAICGFCKSENACYSKKIGAKDGIGGEDMYRASCHACYLKL